MIMLTSILFSLLLPLMTKFFWRSMIIILSITLLSSMPLIQYMSCVNINKFMMMDSMSSSLIVLSIWITLLMLMASSKIQSSSSSMHFTYTVILLLLILIMSFSMNNILLFYIMFEASLIPTMILIMLWGYQPERLQASMYLMMYTVCASLPLLIIIMSLMHENNHLMMSYYFTNMPKMFNQHAMWLITILAFMVKLPLYSVHLWLPKAHVEAPIAGSMILAAILLKLGGYGLMRITLMFPNKVMILTSLLMSLSLVGGVISSFICLRQTDMKSLIAYSSIGHMGLLIAGTMSNSSWGLNGSLMMMIAHGLISSALFCLGNLTYDITHTRSIPLTKGIMISIPTLSMWWFMILAANMAAPPSINLMSEIMLITGTLSSNLKLMIPLMMISFLGAAYSLFLYSSLNHGWKLMSMNSELYINLRHNLLLILHLAPAILLIMNITLIGSL